MRSLVAGLSAGALLLTASGGPGPDAPAGASAPSSSAGALLAGDRPLQPASTERPLQPVGTPGTEPVETGNFPAGGAPAHLVDVRAAGHATFDRLVLEFSGDEVPSHRVGYVEPPVTEDGSGREVPLAGAAFLQVRVTPASGVDLSGEQPRYTYTGRDHVQAPGAQVLTEAVRTGDFEAMLSWTLGLEERVPFGVTTLQDPARLVVDVLHPDDARDTVRPFGPAGTDAVESPAAGEPVVLTDVRLGAHDGFDRIVLETSGAGEAGYRVGYTEDPRAAGSGRPLDVPGEATLGITLDGLLLPPEAPPGVEPWDGDPRLAVAGTQALQELVTDTVFEGVFASYAGLDRQRPFAVARLDSPPRIVVDVLTRAPDEVRLAATCTDPDRYAVDHPADWSVNPGGVVPPCSRFAPGPVEPEEATDAREAPIAFSVESVPFDRVTAPASGERERVELTLDGRDAVRVFQVTEEGLYPSGTLITSYAVDLGTGPGGPRTLVANAVGLPGVDHAYATAVLDSMVRTLELDPGGQG